MKKVLSILLLLLFTTILVSCQDRKIVDDTVQVVFYTYKGDYSVETRKNIQKGSKIEAPADPERDGFIFVKWSLSNKGDGEWIFSEHTVDKSITLFAIWDQGELTIDYVLNGGSFDVGQNVPEVFEVNTIVFFPIPKKEGYNFVGWFLKPAEEIVQGETGIRDTTGIYKNITINALWAGKDIRVTFKSEVSGVTLPKPSIQLIKFGSTINFPDYTGQVPGYTFLGWFDATGKQYINGEPFDRATQVTITAKFAEN